MISGFFRPIGLVGDMGGGSLEVAEALDDRVGERWVSLPLGALPVEALLEKGPEAAKRAVDAMLAEGLPPALTRPVFYPVGGGWRAIAKAHMAAAGAPVPVVHGYTVDTAAIRAFARSLWRPAKPGATAAGVPARRARTLPAAALVLDRTLKRLAPEKVVFSALGLREGWIYAQLSEAERYRDPLIEGAALVGLPAARVPRFAAALVPWTAELFPGETRSEARLRIAACALSDMGWRDHPDLRAAEMFRRLLQAPFIGIEHPERAFVAAAIHARYNGKADDPALLPAVGLLSRATRRRALILGKALTLAYRLSAGVPEVLEGSRLTVGTDRVTLEVGRLARVPDSEGGGRAAGGAGGGGRRQEEPGRRGVTRSSVASRHGAMTVMRNGPASDAAWATAASASSRAKVFTAKPSRSSRPERISATMRGTASRGYIHLPRIVTSLRMIQG